MDFYLRFGAKILSVKGLQRVWS